MRPPLGRWRTRDYRVTLSDGSTKQVYALSAEEARERVRRHLERARDPRSVVSAERS